MIRNRSEFSLIALARYTNAKVQITGIVTEENKTAATSAEGEIAHRLSDNKQDQQICLKSDSSPTSIEILMSDQAIDNVNYPLEMSKGLF